jgi:NAD(P)-dependent dehydrogenase (short-subunit alcohol dehydrogenase family)
MGEFQDSVAIVTGGASGIGRALCEELGRRGAVVVVADIDGDGAAEVARAVGIGGGLASSVQIDVAEEMAVKALVGEAAVEHGRLDYIFNNAGIGVGGEQRDMNADLWRRVVEVDLMGVVHGSAAAYALMVRQGSGHIVNTSSMAGLIGMPTTVSYTAAKHGVVGLSVALRAEGEALGVKVSVVCPGFVDSNIFYTATLLQVDREELLALPMPKKIPAPKAAEIILAGVQRNRAIIVFPLLARLFWRLHRLSPSLMAPLTRKVIRDFRSIRKES